MTHPATRPVTHEEWMRSNRARYNPTSMSVHRKNELARRVATEWYCTDKETAFDKFRLDMVTDYGWTLEEANSFLFTQSRRISKAWDDLGSWCRGSGEITFEEV